MTDGSIDMIFEIAIRLIEYPGAFLHWLFLKRKVPFRTITEKHYYKNLLVSLLLYAVIGYITYQIIQ